MEKFTLRNFSIDGGDEVKRKDHYGVIAAVMGLCVLMVIGCSDQNQSKASKDVPARQTADPILGKSIYTSKCVACHGVGGTGSDQGPPLVHKIYKPSHHADYSFYKAVATGVQSHHWRFGNMEAIPEVSPESVGHIIAYVRQQQRLVGIE